MPGLFVDEEDIRNYVTQVASVPANVKVTADGKQRLNYRHLNIKIGVSCYVLTQQQIRTYAKTLDMA